MWRQRGCPFLLSHLVSEKCRERCAERSSEYDGIVLPCDEVSFPERLVASVQRGFPNEHSLPSGRSRPRESGLSSDRSAWTQSLHVCSLSNQRLSTERTFRRSVEKGGEGSRNSAVDVVVVRAWARPRAARSARRCGSSTTRRMAEASAPRTPKGPERRQGPRSSAELLPWPPPCTSWGRRSLRRWNRNQSPPRSQSH